MNKKIYIENSTPCIVLDGSVYEIENPNAAGVMQNGKFFLWHTESNGSYKHTESEGVDCEWPYGVELIETCKWRGNRDACANEVCWDLEQCQGNPTIKLARLIPEEKKDRLLEVIKNKSDQLEAEHKARLKGDLSVRSDAQHPTFTESAYKEFEGKGKLIGHIIDDFKNGKEIFVPAVESSEPQENLTEALATFSKKFREYQQGIDPEISKAIQKGLWDLIGTPVSAPSESQEELLSEILENWQDFITDTDNNDTDFSLAKQQFMKAELEKFKITRNP